MATPLVSDNDRAGVCYATAYFVLARYVFQEPGRVLHDFEKNPDYAAKFFYVMTCRLEDRDPHPEDVRTITAHSGILNDDRRYHIVQFPVFPPVNLLDLPEADLAKAIEQTVLAPYFAAIVFNDRREIERYLILNQSPGGGTTLREVSPDFNANRGPGAEPTLAAFVSSLREMLAPGAALPQVIAGVSTGEAKPQKRWWQFWKR